MSVEVSQYLNLDAINSRLAGETPEKIVEWAVNTFDPDKIYSLTSAGLSAPLTLDLLDRTAKEGISPKIPIIHNDTGFLPDEVYEYRDKALEPAFDFKSIYSGPTEATIKYIEGAQFWDSKEQEFVKLWDYDKDKYRQLTKLDPLSKVIGELGVQALITGVRQDQTENRQGLNIVTYGADGELRVNPNFWTPKVEVENRLETLIKEKRVPRHPLYLVVDFVDDWQFVGGLKDECGVNDVTRLTAVPTFMAQKSA